jgi:hypothetical protein
MSEVSLAARSLCGRCGIGSNGAPPHKGFFIEKRRIFQAQALPLRF